MLAGVEGTDDRELNIVLRDIPVVYLHDQNSYVDPSDKFKNWG